MIYFYIKQSARFGIQKIGSSNREKIQALADRDHRGRYTAGIKECSLTEFLADPNNVLLGADWNG